MSTPYVPSNRFSIVNPATLQAQGMQVIETISSDLMISDRMAKFKELWASYDPPNAAQYDVDTLEFDPVKINQENNAFFEMLVRDRVNQAARAVTLIFAVGTDLEAIASRYPGGIPRLTSESDEHYRNRIWLSTSTFSPHGNSEAYSFYALTSMSGLLRDASATCVPGTPNVTITVMLDGPPVDVVRDSANRPVPDINGFYQLGLFPTPLPTDQQMSIIRAYVTDKSRKGLTDVVTVNKAKLIEIDYKIRIWLLPTWDWKATYNSILLQMVKLIEGNRWLGVSLTIATIEAAAVQPGVFDVKVDEPAHNVIAGLHQVIIPRSVTLEFAGFAGP